MEVLDNGDDTLGDFGLVEEGAPHLVGGEAATDEEEVREGHGPHRRSRVCYSHPQMPQNRHSRRRRHGLMKSKMLADAATLRLLLSLAKRKETGGRLQRKFWAL